ALHAGDLAVLMQAADAIHDILVPGVPGCALPPLMLLGVHHLRWHRVLQQAVAIPPRLHLFHPPTSPLLDRLQQAAVPTLLAAYSLPITRRGSVRSHRPLGRALPEADLLDLPPRMQRSLLLSGGSRYEHYRHLPPSVTRG